VPYECDKVVAAFLENPLSDLTNLIHDWITHFSFSQQLLGRTDNRASISSVDTCPLQLLYDLGIVDMGAVPFPPLYSKSSACQAVYSTLHPESKSERVRPSMSALDAVLFGVRSRRPNESSVE
jgi:hypothetical protein